MKSARCRCPSRSVLQFFCRQESLERVGVPPIHRHRHPLLATNADSTKGYRHVSRRLVLSPRSSQNQPAALGATAATTVLLAHAFSSASGRRNSSRVFVFGARRPAPSASTCGSGNVREWQNRVRRAVIMSEAASRAAAPRQRPRPPHGPAPRLRSGDKLETDDDPRGLQRNGGKITGAAPRAAIISRPTLYEDDGPAQHRAAGEACRARPLRPGPFAEAIGRTCACSSSGAMSPALVSSAGGEAAIRVEDVPFPPRRVGKTRCLSARAAARGKLIVLRSWIHGGTGPAARTRARCQKSATLANAVTLRSASATKLGGMAPGR